MPFASVYTCLDVQFAQIGFLAAVAIVIWFTPLYRFPSTGPPHTNFTLHPLRRSCQGGYTGVDSLVTSGLAWSSKIGVGSRSMTSGTLAILTDVLPDMERYLRAIASRIAPSTETDDLLQEVWLRLLRSSPVLPEDNPAAGLARYARTILLNCARDRSRCLPHSTRRLNRTVVLSMAELTRDYTQDPQLDRDVEWEDALISRLDFMQAKAALTASELRAVVRCAQEGGHGLRGANRQALVGARRKLRVLCS